MSPAKGRLSAAITLFVAVGCGAPPKDEPAPTVFIALQRDFNGFRSWHRTDLGIAPDDGVHTAGRRVIYLNKLPPKGSTEFPVGTVLVKTIDEDAETPGKTFVMVKRGGNYNASGTKNWEWFELAYPQDDKPIIKWRGIAPPADEGYGGPIVGGSCNDCHTKGIGNDYVLAEPLQLKTF